MIPDRLQTLLDTVEKPGRYIGGEVNEIVKDKAGKTRIAFCFPDTYEIGMSNLGMKILYGVLNRMESRIIGDKDYHIRFFPCQDI